MVNLVNLKTQKNLWLLRKVTNFWVKCKCCSNPNCPSWSLSFFFNIYYAVLNHAQTQYHYNIHKYCERGPLIGLLQIPNCLFLCIFEYFYTFWVFLNIFKIMIFFYTQVLEKSTKSIVHHIQLEINQNHCRKWCV